jgi:hypothetical protein
MCITITLWAKIFANGGFASDDSLNPPKYLRMTISSNTSQHILIITSLTCAASGHTKPGALFTISIIHNRYSSVARVQVSQPTSTHHSSDFLLPMYCTMRCIDYSSMRERILRMLVYWVTIVYISLHWVITHQNTKTTKKLGYTEPKYYEP